MYLQTVIMEWTNAKVINLIDMYHERPVLWDCKNKDYKDRNMRHDLLMEIAISIDAPKDEVERKLKNLTSHFTREMKKEEISKKSGSGTDNIYKSKWFAFKSMAFLKDRNKPRRTINTEDEGNIWEQSHFDISEESALEEQLFGTSDSEEHLSGRAKESSDPPQHITSRKRARTDQVSEAYAIMKNISESRVQKDEYSLFGEQVAIKLRKLPTAYARSMVQHILQTTLFEAEMGKYNNPPAPAFQHSGMPYHPPPMTYPFPISAEHSSFPSQSLPNRSCTMIPSGSYASGSQPPRRMSSTESHSGMRFCSEEDGSSSFNSIISDI